MKDNSRQTALNILNQLDKKRLALDEIIDDFFNKSTLSRLDLSLANAIVFGVCRWRGSLDWILAELSNRPLSKIDPRVKNILRIGLFQIIYMDKIPDSAAVNTSVNLSKKMNAKWISGFINGILRSYLREKEKIEFPDRNKSFSKYISVTKSFPEWLVEKWIKKYGESETDDLCNSINDIPPITIRTNSLKISRDNLIKELETCAGIIKKTNYSEIGISLKQLRCSVSDMEPFKKGLFQVQDEAAQIVSYLLNPEMDDFILDACAGLGGKTGHIAQLSENKGFIYVLDNSEKKISLLKKEMERFGYTISDSIIHDLQKKLPDLYNSKFDKILLDAPCSGLGVLRRNPDSKWSHSKKNLIRYQKRQLLFLENLKDCLKKSGKIVYVVCSSEIEENEIVIEKFLKNNKDFIIEKEFSGLNNNIKTLINPEGYFKTYPLTNEMDGFFAVSLVKT